jgi:Leucine-rich repeat (LRR) protein
MVQTLRLPNACLRELPDLSQLPLEALELQGNNLQSLENLPTTLKRLDMSQNSLINDGIFFPFPHLEKLNLSHNRMNIYEGDDFLICFPSLKYLDLSDNFLRGVSFLRNTQVEELDVSINRLQTISGLPLTLKKLIADTNDLTMIQSKLPPLLEIMDLSHNQLRYAGLPLNWSSCLRELHVDKNKIERFPRKLPDSLEILTMNENQLTELPSKLPESLRIFLVRSNKLRFLPDYRYHKRFNIFDVTDNCLTEIPQEFRAVVFQTQRNWDEPIHHRSHQKIKQCWKRYLLRLRLRHFKRVWDVKEELFIISMMPERWEQVDVIDPIWFRKGSCRIRTDPH